MKHIIPCLLILFSYCQDAIGQIDSIFGQRTNELMKLNSLITAYDSSCIYANYKSYDSAANLNIDSGYVFKLLTDGMYFSRKVIYRDSVPANELQTTFQGNLNMIYVDETDSSIFVYNKDNNINITGVPLFDTNFNQIYLQDVFITTVDSLSAMLTVLFKPGAQYKRMEIFYQMINNEISGIKYYSDKRRRQFEEDSVGIDYVHVENYVFSRSSPDSIAITTAYFTESRYFIRSGDLYIPGTSYPGYIVNPVF